MIHVCVKWILSRDCFLFMATCCSLSLKKMMLCKGECTSSPLCIGFIYKLSPEFAVKSLLFHICAVVWPALYVRELQKPFDFGEKYSLRYMSSRVPCKTLIIPLYTLYSVVLAVLLTAASFETDWKTMLRNCLCVKVIMICCPSYCFSPFLRPEGVEAEDVALYTVPSVLWKTHRKRKIKDRRVWAGKGEERSSSWHRKFIERTGSEIFGSAVRPEEILSALELLSESPL